MKARFGSCLEPREECWGPIEGPRQPVRGGVDSTPVKSKASAIRAVARGLGSEITMNRKLEKKSKKMQTDPDGSARV